MEFHLLGEVKQVLVSAPVFGSTFYCLAGTDTFLDGVDSLMIKK